MRTPDVNVLLHAFRSESVDHERAARWLADAVERPEPLCLTPSVLHGFIRIVTSPRIYAVPTPLDLAFAQVERMRTDPGTTMLLPGPRHWDIFTRLCVHAEAKGNLVSDAAHAAIAIEHGATWVTLDRDFARFEGLRWETLPRIDG